MNLSKLSALCFLLVAGVTVLSQEKEEPRVLLQAPGMKQARLKADVPYKAHRDSNLVMDVYYPEAFDFNSFIPVVVIVYGYSQAVQKKLTGTTFMKWQWYTSWCRLFTTADVAAIVYETTAPVEDMAAVLQFLKSNGSDLKIDPKQIGLFSVSGNASVAVDALLDSENESLKCGAFLYPYLLTADSNHKEAATNVAKQYGFVLQELHNSTAWNTSRPMFLVQAGKDQSKGIKETTGEFLQQAHSQNLPITFINYHQGIHGFDAFQNTPSTKRILQDVLAFIAENLGPK